jgi:hypothetical protein
MNRRFLAFLLFSAVLMPLGFLVHLLAELAGVGTGAHFAARHAYMLIATALAVLSLIGASATTAGSEALRGVLALLPRGGRSPRLFALSLTVQMTVAFATQAGEGLVVPASSLAVVVAAALLAAVAGALVCAAFAERIVRCVAAILALAEATWPPAHRVVLRNAAPRRPAHAFAASVLSRPPPGH